MLRQKLFLSIILGIFLFTNLVVTNSFSEVPPPHKEKTIVYDDETILIDNWYYTKKLFLTIKEGWKSKFVIEVTCGLKTKHTVKSTIGVIRSEEEKLVKSFGGKIGFDNLASINLGISKITGITVTLSKEESASTEFEFPSSPNKKTEWNVYQKYVQYEFKVIERFFDIKEQTSTYSVVNSIMNFKPLQNSIPFDCRGTNFVGLPGWFHVQAGLWLNGNINDEKFKEEIRTLIDEKTLNVVYKPVSETIPTQIPHWFKDVISWWLDGKLDDVYIMTSLEYLIQKELIVL